MISLSDDVRIPAFVGIVMAMWIFPFLIAGTIAAIVGAPQSHAPLVVTLLLTSIATATISVVTASLNTRDGSAETVDNQSVATFIFVNSAGTMVGLITNISETIERWEPAGPNGLTFVYEQVYREQIPVLLYAAVLLSMILVAAFFIVRGSALLSTEERPTEEELSRLSRWSSSLLALWIFTCMRWQPLSWGAETVATIWTIIVYVGATLVACWIYGLAGFRIVRWLSHIAFQLARNSAALLSDPRTWRLVFFSLLATGFFVCLACAVLILISWSTTYIAIISDHTPPEQARRALLSSATALASTLRIVASVLVGCLIFIFLWLIPKLLKTMWKSATPPTFMSGKRLWSISARLPKLQGHFGWFGVAFVSSWQRVSTAATKRKSLIAKTFVAAVSLIVLAASTNDFNLPIQDPNEDEGTVITAPLTQFVPIASPVAVSVSMVSFESVNLCESSPGATEWAYESDSRVSIDLSACRLPISVGNDEALIVIAMSTNGVSRLDEESRSKRRLGNLITWASRQFDPDVPVYGLDLGMATGPNSHFVISRAFGSTWSERPVMGLIMRSNVEIDSTVVSVGVMQLLAQNQSLRAAYSRCSIYVDSTAGLEPIFDCAENPATNLTLAE